MASRFADPSALRQLGLIPERAGALLDAAERLVSDGPLPSLQIALARHGQLAIVGAFGRVICGGREMDSTAETLYVGFSTTKTLVSSAIWILLAEEKLSLLDRVADIVPEFEKGGKDEIRVEQLLTHTAGFPDAPFEVLDWNNREKRLENFASWKLQWEPGSRFHYHATSSMWVLAEIIERLSAMDFRDFIRERIIERLGLGNFYLGLPDDVNPRVADVRFFGEPMSEEELTAAGILVPRSNIDDPDNFLPNNRADVRAVGVPAGGAIFSASDFALYYQALLDASGGANATGIWQPSILGEALQNYTGEFIDPWTGHAAVRGLGVVMSGGPDRMFRGFPPKASHGAFGHQGAGGQVAWADPATGISFVAVSDGLDRNPLRFGVRGLQLSIRAAECVESE